MQVQQQKQEVSQIQSLNLVQNLLLASIGSISYVRNLFHESNYTSKKVQGLPIRTLQRGHTHQADLLLDWLELGCFDALRKQFLKTVHLYIKKGDSLLESYSFSFKYPDGKAEMEFSELSSTKTGLARATTLMIRRLLTLTEQLSPLPTEVELTMRIEYYDNVPPDYEPPLFKEFEGQDIELTVHENIGTVVSQFHRVDLMVGFQEAKQSAQGAEKETIPPASVPFDTMFDSGRHSDADTEDGLLSQDDDVNMDSPASLPLAQVRKRDVTSRSQASTKWDIPMDIDELDLASTQPIISLSQSLTDEIVSSSQRVTRAQLLEILNPAQEAEEQPTIDVKCVCTFDREWETIECTTCHQGSHRPCYGNLITPFECYNCRNIPEQAYLKAVQVRACYYAISITARPTLATLSSNLGASMPDTQRLVSHLRQLGICPAKRINISKDRKLIEPWLDDSVIEALALPTPAPTPKPKVRNLMQGKKRKISTVINDVQVL